MNQQHESTRGSTTSRPDPNENHQNNDLERR